MIWLVQFGTAAPTTSTRSAMSEPSIGEPGRATNVIDPQHIGIPVPLIDGRPHLACWTSGSTIANEFLELAPRTAPGLL